MKLFPQKPLYLDLHLCFFTQTWWTRGDSFTEGVDIHVVTAMLSLYHTVGLMLLPTQRGKHDWAHL